MSYRSFKIRLELNNKQGTLAKNSKIKLPRFGWVRLAENVNFEGIKNATISRKANHWFVSFRVPLLKRKENYKIKTIENKEVVGVDLGIKNLATLSDGTIFPNLRPYKKYKRKLKSPRCLT